MTKEIPLTQGKVAIVDDHQYERVSQFKWNAQRKKGGKWYAGGHVNGVKVYLHRFLTNAPAGMEVDHKNGNGLDCTDNNMRICTRTQNTHNSKKRSDNTSGYIGVSWSGNRKKWVAQIQVNNKSKWLGYFKNVIDAALTYDAAVRELHGDFAKPNF